MAPSRKPDPARPSSVAATLAAWVRGRPHGERITVGCSGGLDSSVLLHALAAARAALRPDLALAAHHVHHGLLPEADAWLRHVEALCAALGVPCSAERVTVDVGSGRGVEAAARQARYESFARRATDCVLLAHHADDQAETVLLQLLRGGGPRALSGMPARRMLGTIALERPLLALGRAAIADYARAHAIDAVNDPSNADTRLARGRLRARLWPALRASFPDGVEQIESAARQQSEAALLVDELARLDLASCLSEGALVLEAWQRLSPPRRRNALRRWLADAGAATPSWHAIADTARQLERVGTGLRRALRSADSESPLELRTFRGRASIAAPLRPPSDRSDGQNSDPSLPSDLSVPGMWRAAQGELQVSVVEQDTRAPRPMLLAPPSSRGKAGWRLRLRRPGDRIRLNERSGHVALKNVFQTHAIPPWQRTQWPLICDDERVIAVAGLAVDARYAADAGWLVEWKPVSSPDPALALRDGTALGRASSRVNPCGR